MIRETEKRLPPGAACAVLFVHGILGSPAQFAPFLPLVPQDWSFCNLLLLGHGGGARDFSAASMAVWREQARQAFAELRAQHETVVIAAHSMGTLFAVQEAVRSPVEGLFLLNVPLNVHVRPRALRNAWLNYGGTPRDPWGRAAVTAYGVERDRNVLHYAGWPPRFFELFGEIRRTRPLVRQLAVACRADFSERDELVSVRSARGFAENPQAVVTMLPHSGHAYYEAQEDLPLLQRDFRAMLQECEKKR